MKGIEIPILVYTEKDFELEKLGIESAISNAQIVKWTFFQIAAINEYEEDGVMFTAIGCNGQNYISPAPYELIKQLILENL